MPEAGAEAGTRRFRCAGQLTSWNGPGPQAAAAGPDGADVHVVQELLGMPSVATTKLCTHSTVGAVREVYAPSHPRAADCQDGGAGLDRGTEAVHIPSPDTPPTGWPCRRAAVCGWPCHGR